MRKCKIFRCSSMASWICCADCPEGSCPNRCLNHPDRCKCVRVRAPAPKRVPKYKYDHAQILALAKEGYTNKEIMAKMGCSKSAVSAALRRAGFKRVGWGKEGLHE